MDAVGYNRATIGAAKRLTRKREKRESYAVEYSRK
jgi:hypothetical protein